MVIMEEVDAPNRFVGRDHFSDAEGNQNLEMPSLTMEVELIEENGVTRVISRSIAESAEQLEELIKMGMVEGFTSQLNRFDALFAE